MHHLLTVACFAVAIICYIAGAGSSLMVLFLAGGALELMGWRRIVKRRRG